MDALYDPQDPHQYVQYLRALHDAAQRKGGVLSKGDAASVLAALGKAQLPVVEIEKAMYDAGVDGTSQPIPISSTGAVSFLRLRSADPEDGGFLAWQPDDHQFVWFFWRAPLDQDDDYLVYDVQFEPGQDLVGHPDVTYDLTTVARVTGTDPATLRSWAYSDDVLEKLKFLQALVDTDGPHAVTITGSSFDTEDMFRRFALWADLTKARRSKAKVDEVLARLGVGARASDEEIADLLAQINERRRQIGMRPLDPAAAGWTDDDVRLEAARIRAGNPPRSAREELLSWE